MMKRYLTLLTLTGLLLAACGDRPSLPPDASRNMATTPAVLPTSTPTPMGTWETVIAGVVYDDAIGPDKPIVGALVSYNVVHSYFIELQTGRLNQTETDEQGKFSLPVLVHDTDSIRLVIEAPGFISHEEKLVGIGLVAGGDFSIGLTRLVTATVGPP